MCKQSRGILHNDFRSNTCAFVGSFSAKCKDRFLLFLFAGGNAVEVRPPGSSAMACVDAIPSSSRLSPRSRIRFHATYVFSMFDVFVNCAYGVAKKLRLFCLPNFLHLDHSLTNFSNSFCQQLNLLSSKNSV